MKYFYLFILILFFNNCTLNKVSNRHGVQALEKKNQDIVLRTTNKNDIIASFGPPSVKSSFNENLWIYIERETTKKGILSLGKNVLSKNNVLLIEFNSKGLIKNKVFYDLNKMNDLEFSKLETENQYSKNTFVYDFLSSMRKKINDPLGQRKK